MYSAIPKDWREDFDVNVTLTELNDSLMELHLPTIAFIAVLMVTGVLGNILVIYVYTTKYYSSTHRYVIHTTFLLKSPEHGLGINRGKI